MVRKINAEGLSLIKQWEGLRLTAYLDVANVLTIGYGHTSAAGSPAVKTGMKITEAEATRILRSDLAKFEARVNSLVKVPLTDNQFAALVSFDYNTGALHKSTLLKKLNKGDYASVPKELAKWVNAGGKRVQGLVNRRSAEAGLWAKGEYVSSNFVSAEPEVSSVKTLLSPEKAIAAAGSLGFSFTSLTQLTGPLSYALAAIAVLLVIGAGVYLYIRWKDEKATTSPVDTTEAEKAVEQQAAIDAAVAAALAAAGFNTATATKASTEEPETVTEDQTVAAIEEATATVEEAAEAVTETHVQEAETATALEEAGETVTAEETATEPEPA